MYKLTKKEILIIIFKKRMAYFELSWVSFALLYTFIVLVLGHTSMFNIFLFIVNCISFSVYIYSKYLIIDSHIISEIVSHILQKRKNLNADVINVYVSKHIKNKLAPLGVIEMLSIRVHVVETYKKYEYSFVDKRRVINYITDLD